MYIVVENAGYIGEKDVFSSMSRKSAEQWVEHNYARDEIESLHVDLAFENAKGERTFELY